MTLAVSLTKHMSKVMSAFSSKTISHIKITEAAPGQVKFKMEVEKSDCNLYGTMHGGLGATLVDFCTSVAILSNSSRWGISTDMQITYMKPAALGSEIQIVGNCDKAGKTLAFSTCYIYNEKGDMLLKGNHTKFMGTPLMDLNDAESSYPPTDNS